MSASRGVYAYEYQYQLSMSKAQCVHRCQTNSKTGELEWLQDALQVSSTNYKDLSALEWLQDARDAILG